MALIIRTTESPISPKFDARDIRAMSRPAIPPRITCFHFQASRDLPFVASRRRKVAVGFNPRLAWRMVASRSDGGTCLLACLMPLHHRGSGSGVATRHEAFALPFRGLKPTATVLRRYATEMKKAMRGGINARHLPWAKRPAARVATG